MYRTDAAGTTPPDGAPAEAAAPEPAQEVKSAPVEPAAPASLAAPHPGDAEVERVGFNTHEYPLEPEGPAHIEAGWVEPIEPLKPDPVRIDPDPVVAAPPVPPRGWLESGLYMITLPIAITAGIMFAPVAWILNARQKP